VPTREVFRAMRRFRWALTIPACCFAFVLHAAEPTERERTLPRPSWAWGVLGLRNIDGTLAQLARYCDRAATNSGALVRLSLSTLLFPVPLEDGLKKDGPAVIFFLDPGQAGGRKDEKALLLPVSDPALLKESLEAVFGATMQENRLQVSVPRGFTEPDATLLIRLAPGGLLVAPNAQILKELETLAGGKDASQFVAADGPDAVAELNFEALRRIERKRLDDFMERTFKATALAAPSAAGQVEDGQQRLQKFLRELDRLEVHARIEAKEIRLASRLRALADTELAQRWDRAPDAPAGTWNSWCGAETALFVTGRFPAAWACPEKDTAAWLARYLPADSAAGQAAQAACARTLSAWLGQLDGDLACAVQVDAEGAFFPLTLFGAKNDADVLAAFDAFLAPAATSLAERLRADFKLPADQPLPAVLEKMPDGPTGVVRHTLKFQEAKVEAWARERLGAVGGWPPEFCARRATGGLVLGWGRGAETCVAAEPVARGAGAALFPEPPEGTAGCALLHPVAAMRVFLRQWCHLDEAATRRVLDGLANTPLSAFWGQGDGAVQLELRVPVESLRTALEGYLRMLKEGFDPDAKPATEQ